MTISDRYFVREHDVDIALRLLGPPNVREMAPNGCLEFIILMIKNIAVNVLRVINYLFGDHQWYDNRVARQIADNYYASPSPNTILDQRVGELCGALALRANGNVSWAEGLQMNGPQHIVSEEPALSALHPLRELVFEKMTVLANENESVSQKATALRKIAKRRVLTDPVQGDEFFRQAKDSISLVEDGSLKCHFLVKCGKDRALTHPEQAYQLFEQAIETANLITDIHQKWKMHTMIALERASTHAEQALVAADPIQDSFRKDLACEVIVSAQALSDREQALNTANLIQDVKLKEKAWSHVAKAQASSHPQEALAVLHLIQKDDTKANAYLGVANEIATAHPELADECIQKASAIIQASYGRNEKHSRLCAALVKVVQAQAAFQPEKALQTAYQISNSIEKSKALSIAAKGLISINPGLANEVFQQVISDLRDLPDSFETTCEQIIGDIAKAQAIVDIEQALQVADTLQDRKVKFDTFCEMAKICAVVNPEQANALFQKAIDLVNLMKDGYIFDRDQTLVNIVEAQAGINPEQALRNADLILSRYKKTEALGKVVKALASIDIERALEVAACMEERVLKVDALCECAKALFTSNPERSVDIFQQAFELANRISSFQALDHILLAIAVCDESNSQEPLNDDCSQ